MFGLGNSKSKTTNNNKEITFNNVDYGGGMGSKTNVNSAIDGDNNTTTNHITATDFGSVQGGFDVAKSALDNITSLAASTSASNASLAEKAAQNGSEKVIGATSKLIWGVLGFGGLVLFAMKKKG